MTAIKKDPVFSAPLAWDDPDFEGKDVSLKDYNILWHECIANEAVARMLFSGLSADVMNEDLTHVHKVLRDECGNQIT